MTRKNTHREQRSLWPDINEDSAAPPPALAHETGSAACDTPDFWQTPSEERQECRDEQSALDTFMRAAYDGPVDLPLMIKFQDVARWDPTLSDRDRAFHNLFGVDPEIARRTGSATIPARRHRALSHIARRCHDRIDDFILNFTY